MANPKKEGGVEIDFLRRMASPNFWKTVVPGEADLTWGPADALYIAAAGSVTFVTYGNDGTDGDTQTVDVVAGQYIIARVIKVTAATATVKALY